MQQTQRTITAILPKGQQEAASVIRTAAYCRVSTDSSDQELSFAAQVKYYTEAIGKIENSVLVDIYADEGISGRGTAKREDFNRMISDCKKGKIDRILTKSVSRFARNTVDCLQTVRMLADLGVSVLFEKEQLDTAKMSGEVLLAMSGTQAQDESISLGNNMRWSYEQRMKKGEFLGTVPAYGYNLIGCATATVDHTEAQVVRLIADLYLSGMGKQKIANYLNEKQIPRRGGKKWHATTIQYILSNERYVGDALLQKYITTTEYPPRKILNAGTQAQYYVENCLPAILSREQREAILTLQKKRKKDNQGGGHPLSKLLSCSQCGHAYRRVKNSFGAVWQCAGRVSGRSKCELYTVREADVYEALLRMVRKLWASRDEILRPLISRMEALQSKANGTEIKVYQIDKEIAILSRQSLVIADLLASGILDPADFTAQNNALSEKISHLRAKRREHLRQSETDDQINAMRELYEMLSDMECEQTEYDKEMMRAIINRITVRSDTELQIHMKCGLTLTEELPKYYTGRCRRK